jgi:hemoglobin
VFILNFRRQHSHALSLGILNDIASQQDIKTLVDTFYDRVNRDEILGPIFNEIAKVDWDHHLPTMYAFWTKMLFRTGDYKGQPWPKHAVLPLKKEQFERWVKLFCQTVDTHFTGPKASEAKSAALSIADTFQTRAGISNPFLYQQCSGAKPDPLKLTSK